MEVIDLVLDQYKKFDQIIKDFCKTTGLSCVPNCSYCCRHWWVEASVLEVLPLAREIYARGQEQVVMELIEHKDSLGDEVCVLLSPEATKATEGYCRYYQWRPLMCRLFGFALRRNRRGELEFCSCRIVREAQPSSIRRAEMAIRGGLKLPVYQDAFMQVASLDPSRGYRRVHINRAIKEALEYLYWIRPRGKGWRKASGY